MNQIKVGVCFLDVENNIIVKKRLESKWFYGIEHELKENYDVLMDNSYPKVLTESLKQELTPDIIKEMLDELLKK